MRIVKYEVLNESTYAYNRDSVKVAKESYELLFKVDELTKAELDDIIKYIESKAYQVDFKSRI